MGSNPSSGTSTIYILSHYPENEDIIFQLVEFSKILDTTCIKTDFDSWSVSSCFLGENRSFLRRKSASVCLVASDFEHSTASNGCECTITDFECVQ
jgi:hypothetical protein